MTNTASPQKRKAGVHNLAGLNKPEEKKPKLNQSKKTQDPKKGKFRTLKDIAKEELPEDDDFMVSMTAL